MHRSCRPGPNFKSTALAATPVHFGRYAEKMKQFSFKTLFLVVLVFALGSVVYLWVHRNLAEQRFRQTVDSIWSHAPVSSSSVSVNDTNDIVLKFNGKDLLLTSGGSLIQSPDGIVGNYDLRCAAGNFRLMVEGDIYAEAIGEIASGQRPYYVLRDAFMLDNRAQMSTAPLWIVRGLFMPVGCETGLQHFETSTKMGFISGRVSERTRTMMHVFDSTGSFAIVVVPLDPRIETWDDLADRLCLVEDALGE